MSDFVALNLYAAIVFALLALILWRLSKASKQVETALAEVRRAEAPALAEQDEHALRAADEAWLDAGEDRLRAAIRDEQNNQGDQP